MVVPENVKLLLLPPYSPDLNPVENIWEELREKNFNNKIFIDIDAMEKQLLYGLKYLEGNPKITKSIVAWPWIINAICN